MNECCECCGQDYPIDVFVAALPVQQLAAMADTEQPEKRDSCDWEKDRGKPQAAPCGSEADLFKVTRRNGVGAVRENNICGRHISDAWGKFRVEEAVKRPAPSRTTG